MYSTPMASATWMPPAAKASRPSATVIRPVAAAIAEQAQRLITCHESFYNDRRAELYVLLSGIMPGDLQRFFLCNQRRGSH